MDSKNQAPDSPSPRRRGRTPKPTDHPIGQLIRDRRQALGLSLAQLAEAVGIGPTSISLVAAMEHGKLPPRRDVAEKLADVLGLDRDLLIEWSSMRVASHAPTDVLERRQRFDSALRSAWHVAIEPLEPLESSAAPPGLVQRRDQQRLVSVRGVERTTWSAQREVGPQAVPSHLLALYAAGADPDSGAEPVAYLDRARTERLVQGKADLIRPIAYLIDDEDLERLRRPSYPEARPSYALVSRPLPVVIDSREPYAIRFGRKVILAYCAWDGRELVVLEPPGQRGFARLKARNPDALEALVVGQVVAISWFPLDEAAVRP